MHLATEVDEGLVGIQDHGCCPLIRTGQGYSKHLTMYILHVHVHFTCTANIICTCTCMYIMLVVDMKSKALFNPHNFILAIWSKHVQDNRVKLSGREPTMYTDDSVH